MSDFNDEDFNMDDFMNESNSDFEMKLEEYRDNMMALAIETNYKNIEVNGINEYHLRHLSVGQLVDLNETFKLMISHFEELEDYEKCATVLKQLTIVRDALSQKNVII